MIYEKLPLHWRNRYGGPMSEIPYGFKNLWQIKVTDYSGITNTFTYDEITGVTLNGESVSADQLVQLFDYNRDLASIIRAVETSGLLITLSDYDPETKVFTMVPMIQQTLQFNGVVKLLQVRWLTTRTLVGL